MRGFLWPQVIIILYYLWRNVRVERICCRYPTLSIVSGGTEIATNMHALGSWPGASPFCINTRQCKTPDHSLRHFDRYLIFQHKICVQFSVRYWPLSPCCCVLLKIIFHVMGKMLCKIILVYYKLYGPTVIFLILEVLGFNCSFITIFVIFLQIIVWQEEMKNTLVALS